MTLPRRITRALGGFAAMAATAVLAGTALAADHDVGIAGLAFEPQEITVAAGDTVIWTVTQSIGSPHSVTSGAPGDPDEGSLFDSGDEGLLNDGDTYEFTFEDAGTFPYYCTVHGASMSGTVIVAAAGQSPAAGESPAASPAPASEGPAATPAATAGEPAASPGPSPEGSPAAEPEPHEVHPPVPPESKALAAGILGVTIVLLFVASAIWRRMNPA